MTEERFKIVNDSEGPRLFDDIGKTVINLERTNWIPLSQLLNNLSNERDYFLNIIERIKDLIEMKEYEEALSLIYDVKRTSKLII